MSFVRGTPHGISRVHVDGSSLELSYFPGFEGHTIRKRRSACVVKACLGGAGSSVPGYRAVRRLDSTMKTGTIDEASGKGAIAAEIPAITLSRVA